MPPAAPRTRISHATITDGTCTISWYSPPGPEGQLQTVAGSRQFAVGFNTICSKSYQQVADNTHPDVQAIALATYRDMEQGRWKPGRSATPSEPPDIVCALAEATGTPIDKVEDEVRNRMKQLASGELYRDSAGRTHRYYDKEMQARLAADPRVAPIMARLASEKARRLSQEAKQAKGVSILDGLFGPAPPDQRQDAETPSEAA
jgi:hypothetical protein